MAVSNGHFLSPALSDVAVHQLIGEIEGNRVSRISAHGYKLPPTGNIIAVYWLNFRLNYLLHGHHRAWRDLLASNKKGGTQFLAPPVFGNTLPRRCFLAPKTIHSGIRVEKP